MSNILYELAQHHDIQDEVRKEIEEEYQRNNGTLMFESIKRMKYLHAVFQGAYGQFHSLADVEKRLKNDR